jgi:hypothetical protein
MKGVTDHIENLDGNDDLLSHLVYAQLVHTGVIV